MKIKICCISSRAEAELAIASGADVLGLVGHMPSGPGIIADELAAEIVSNVPSYIETFLLTSETSVAGIIAHHDRVKSSAIQIVDKVEKDSHSAIKSALPEVKLVQVIHVLNQSSIQYAKQMAQSVDALLLDSGNPNLAVKELGGTGRVHDWQLSREIVTAVDIPVFLAGGLSESNIKQAITQTKPYGIDLCSSVRTAGTLDGKKLSEFINEARSI